MSPAERRRTYLEVLNGLREVLAVNNDSDPWLERRRNALITAEILFNDKSPADVAVLYAPLLNADDALLPLLLSREGEFEKRRVALAKKLTDLVLSSGMAGAAALPRYRQFLAAMDGLLPAPAAAESGNSALRGTVLFLALLAPLAWLAAAVPGGLWPGVEFLAGGGPASWWENTWLGPLVLAMAPLAVPGSPRGGDAGGLLHPSFVAHDLGVWQILRDQKNLPQPKALLLIDLHSAASQHNILNQSQSLLIQIFLQFQWMKISYLFVHKIILPYQAPKEKPHYTHVDRNNKDLHQS
jgi:hypothetical protein